MNPKTVIQNINFKTDISLKAELFQRIDNYLAEELFPVSWTSVVRTPCSYFGSSFIIRTRWRVIWCQCCLQWRTAGARGGARPLQPWPPMRFLQIRRVYLVVRGGGECIFLKRENTVGSQCCFFIYSNYRAPNAYFLFQNALTSFENPAGRAYSVPQIHS